MIKMLKEKDTLICIKDFIFHERTKNKYLYNKGDKYIIERIGKWSKYQSSLSKISKRRYFILDNNNISWIFEENELPNLNTLSDYFITLAEWREQQIDSILNEQD